jgi:hypothetical protein
LRTLSAQTFAAESNKQIDFLPHFGVPFGLFALHFREG